MFEWTRCSGCQGRGELSRFVRCENCGGSGESPVVVWMILILVGSLLGIGWVLARYLYGAS